jgi:hypothetical protein
MEAIYLSSNKDSIVCELISQADKLNLKIHRQNNSKISRSENIRWKSLAQQIQQLGRKMNDTSSSQYFKERRSKQESTQAYAPHNEGMLLLIHKNILCIFY